MISENICLQKPKAARKPRNRGVKRPREDEDALEVMLKKLSSIETILSARFPDAVPASVSDAASAAAKGSSRKAAKPRPSRSKKVVKDAKDVSQEESTETEEKSAESEEKAAEPEAVEAADSGDKKDAE